MSALYTSLVRLKMAMNGGELPPMTEIPAEATDYIDPAFTIGLGALTEDETRGLRCPVRECGKFFHLLTQHVNKMHPELGARGLRKLLDIPMTAPLASHKWRARRSAIASAWARSEEGSAVLARGRANLPANWHRAPRDPEKGKKRVFQSVGRRNLSDRCEAQLTHKLIDLQHQIGRSPTSTEARTILGTDFVSYVTNVYGSWNAAKTRFGMDAYSNQYTVRGLVSKEAVLAALRAYHKVHGCLPNVNQAQRPTRTPLIPSRPTICKAMGTESWPEAMRRAASLLNIYGGRYGLPTRVGAA